MRVVAGHRHAQILLERAVLAGQVRHAYLFAGPPAIGKTTLAIEFARLLECERRGPMGTEPCGECPACLRIAHGTHPDVALVEPLAGKRSLDVDTVREVLRAASLAPSAGAWRIFILPEAERMLPAAANALLKTLEEPPPGVVLLLTTSEPEVLLSTIVSRCQLVPLHPLTAEEVAAALEARWDVPAAQAHQLAVLANGRLGWAVRAFQQPELREVRAQTLATLLRLPGAGRDERLRQAGTLAADVETARAAVDLWTLWWRDVTLAACGAAHLATTGEARAQAERIGRALGQERAQSFLQSLLAAQAALDQNANPRLTLDVLMLDLPTVPTPTAWR
jgi:DNA polymerase III subunit delta'